MINSILSAMSGIVQLPWWGYVAYLFIMTQITVISITIFLHRSQAHRALDLHPIASHFFRFWLWMTSGVVTKEWAAIHRKHHAKVETDEDPHSPQTRGLKKVFFEGAELYRAEAKNQETLDRYGEGTPDDWMERYVYTPHSRAGVVSMLIINFILFGFAGVALWAGQMMFMPLFAAGVINGIGHYVGYRNFEPNDTSRNVTPFGIFLGGEELHNNHHAYASSAKFSAKWWEVDMGWNVIRLMQLFGLAKPKRVLPKMHVEPSKSHIDADTLKAFISYRLHVMARYAREVILPVLREEKKRTEKTGRHLLRRASTVLVRDVAFMKVRQTQRLTRLLENFQSLREVYQYRIKLQAIWNQKTASQKELLEALQDWCRQAEATGIETLARFSKRIKTLVSSRA